MPRELSDTVAIVTGGSSGIGLATARALLSHGARVVIVDLHEPLNASLPADYVSTDVRDPQAWQALVIHIEKRYGGIDLAHLHGSPRAPVSDSSPPGSVAATASPSWVIVRQAPSRSEQVDGRQRAAGRRDGGVRCASAETR